MIATTAAWFYVAIPIHLNISIHACALIIIGCVNSIRFLIQENISKTHFSGDDGVVEAVGMSEALKFPLIGGVILVSLYVMIKYLGDWAVNTFLIAYFIVIGMESFRGIINNYTSVGNQKTEDPKSIKYPLIGNPDNMFLGIRLSISKLDIIWMLISILWGLLYVQTRHWTTNNLLGIIFTLFALENMFIGSFKVGAVMLWGLFFYDIFFVFGTDIMETVARKVDGPIKLLFPRKVVIESSKDLSLLGLGDIVIPGIFIALCLRYDFLRNFDRNTKLENRTFDKVYNVFLSWSKPYFWSWLTGYMIGLLTTVVIMIIFQRGQPALLYLVPGWVFSVLIWAFVRRESQNTTKIAFLSIYK